MCLCACVHLFVVLPLHCLVTHVGLFMFVKRCNAAVRPSEHLPDFKIFCNPWTECVCLILTLQKRFKEVLFVSYSSCSDSVHPFWIKGRKCFRCEFTTSSLVSFSSNLLAYNSLCTADA